jgi:hypothetical protein
MVRPPYFTGFDASQQKRRFAAARKQMPGAGPEVARIERLRIARAAP